MKYHNSVREAMRHAAPPEAYFNDWPEELRGKPDDYPLSLNTEFTERPDRVYVRNLEELGELCTVAEELMWSDPESDEFRAYVEETLEHEGQHYAAARQLGAKEHRFGVGFVRVDGELEYYPFFQGGDMQINKLGAAALAGAPYDPSEGDLDSMLQLGYEDPSEVAECIEAFNARGGYDGDPIPQLRGFDGTSTLDVPTERSDVIFRRG